MQAWMRIAFVSVFLVAGCSFQMEAPRETVAWFAARPTAPAPVPGDSVNTPIDDPQVISSADFYNMQAYQHVCMQVSGADGKFGTPVQKMGSEQTSGSVTALFSKFTIPKLWVGRKYSIRVFGFKNRTEVCPFDFKGVSDFAQLGVLDTFVVPDKPSEVIIPVNFVESSEVPPNPQEVNFLATPAVATGNGITVSWSPLPMGYQTVFSWVQGNDQNMNGPSGCSAGNFTGTVSYYIHTPVEPGKWYRYRICTQNGTTVSPGRVTPAVQAIFPTNPCTGDLYSNPVSPGTVCLGPESQQIEFVATNTGFPIWREQGGQRRILNATGLVVNGWQKKFNLNEELTDTAVIDSIAGRVCPEKIHDHRHSNAYTAGCLYYDQGHVSQALNTSSGSAGAPGIDYLEYWNNPISGGEEEAAFFEGNIATCNDKGMRLPVIYETGITSFPPSTWLPNSNPQFWDTSRDGVPSILGVSTWTASARRDPFEPGNTDQYFTWMERAYSTAVYYADGTTALPAVRCVLPAFY